MSPLRAKVIDGPVPGGPAGGCGGLRGAPSTMPGLIGGKRTEQFAVDVRRIESCRGEGVAHVGHELCWTAEVGGSIGRQAQRRDRRPVQTALRLV